MRQNKYRMITKNIRLLVVGFLLFLVVGDAYSLTSSEERKIRLKVVEILEEYGKYSAIDQDFEEYAESFRALFTNGDAIHYNDLNYMTHGDSMNIKEYINALSSRSSTTRTAIKNVKCNSIQEGNGKITIICTFDKYVNVTNECGIEFSSEFFNVGDHHLTATIIYDRETDLCLFDNISGVSNRRFTLPDDYRILRVENNDRLELLYNNMPLLTNAMNQTFIPSTAKVKSKDPDIVIKMKQEDAKCHVWSVSAKAKHWRIMPHIDMGIGEALNIPKNDTDVETKSSSFNMGIDFGYIFPSRSVFKVGVFSGVGLSQTTIDMSLVKGNYSYTSYADVDGDSYMRYYRNLSIEEGFKLTDVTIPVYLDLELHLTRVVSIFTDLGVRVGFNMSKKLDKLSGQSYVYGIYPQYQNLYMDETWGYNGFGNQELSSNNFVEDDLSNVNGFNADAMGKIGFRFNIPGSSIAFELSGSYLFGLTEVIKKDNSYSDAYSISQGLSPSIIYNSINPDLSSTEHVKSLTYGMESIKRQMMDVCFGMIFKF